MLQRFHDGGRDYWWEFHTPVLAGDTGYASWRFSYASRRAGVEGQEGEDRQQKGRRTRTGERHSKHEAIGTAPTASCNCNARQNLRQWPIRRSVPCHAPARTRP